MQRDVKVGIAIGVLLIALIAVFWWTKHNKLATSEPSKEPITEGLPPSGEPVLTPISPGGGPTPPVTPGQTPPTSPTGMPPVMAPGGAPTTAPVPPQPIAKKPTTYKVLHGDTLAMIAKKFYNDSSKFPAIYEANKDKIGPDQNRLKDGMELVIPDLAGTSPTGVPKTGGTGTPPSTAGQQKHVVAAGDSLSSIAKKYYGADTKVNIDRIYQANKTAIGSDPDNIKVGMELVIPPAR